jgi:hypothetical protein
MTQKALQDAVGPTGMSDAVATMMGLKVYSHGTTYTGSPNSPTVTLTSGSGTLSSVTLAKCIPYQVQDGTWRMRFSLTAALSSAARSVIGLSIAGVTFPAQDQGVGGNNAGAAATTYAVASASGSQVTMGYPSATTDTAIFSGDVALASKPTWAY